MPFRDAVQFLKTELVTTRLQFFGEKVNHFAKPACNLQHLPKQRAHHQRRRLHTGGRVLTDAHIIARNG